MRKLLRFALLLFVAVCMSELSFTSENLYAGGEFTIFGGVISSPDEFIGGDTDPMVGIRYGRYYGSILGWESNFAYIPAGGVKAVNLGANLVLNFLPAPIVPFGTIGLGTLISWNGSTETDFMISYGGGIKYYVTDRVGVRFEYRQDRVKLEVTAAGDNEFKGFNELVGGLTFKY